jgi:hypothetical protein
VEDIRRFRSFYNQVPGQAALQTRQGMIDENVTPWDFYLEFHDSRAAGGHQRGLYVS